MAPTRQKARKSTESTTSVDVMGPAPPSEMTPAKTRSPAKTPTTRSPIKKPTMGKLSLAQKQQLIDNLQQEVTERARRLRQQYSAQAQDLRIRIERRVTRIPMHLRRANMGDLLRKYNETTGSSRQATATSSKHNTLTTTKSPSKNILGESRGSRQSPAPPQRRAKRYSDAMSITDKENEHAENPRKRVRSPPLPPSSPRRLNQYPQGLSPKSSTTRSQATRALGPVPVRPMNSSPVKPHLARPISPGKPAAYAPTGGPASILSNMVEKAKSSRAAGARKVTEPSSSASNASAPVGRARRGATQPARPATRNGRGRVSDGSETSTGTTGTTGTTVIKRAAAPAPAKREPAKRTVMGTLKGMRGEASKKLPAAAKPATTTATAGGRVLRKRN